MNTQAPALPPAQTPVTLTKPAKPETIPASQQTITVQAETVTDQVATAEPRPQTPNLTVATYTSSPVTVPANLEENCTNCHSKQPTDVSQEPTEVNVTVNIEGLSPTSEISENKTAKAIKKMEETAEGKEDSFNMKIAEELVEKIIEKNDEKRPPSLLFNLAPGGFYIAKALGLSSPTLNPEGTITKKQLEAFIEELEDQPKGNKTRLGAEEYANEKVLETANRILKNFDKIGNLNNDYKLSPLAMLPFVGLLQVGKIALDKASNDNESVLSKEDLRKLEDLKDI